ncbi:secreted RxLR effector protein 161-like [Lycium barbarum]|uniref:secreted RxLR effector protein 161-like n=1 Tax=Lycium barbarum TaxID=112863 RepID=UPI00293EF10D|nr:secreted RxLR effector protein 161-like [Lycium barbarum]
MTRRDLAFSVQVLSQYMHCPKVSHMEAALRVVRYVKEVPGLGLLMPAENTHQLLAYCDSDWGACLETRRSVTGYLVKLGGALISWKSKRQCQGAQQRQSLEVWPHVQPR